MMLIASLAASSLNAPRIGGVPTRCGAYLSRTICRRLVPPVLWDRAAVLNIDLSLRLFLPVYFKGCYLRGWSFE